MESKLVNLFAKKIVENELVTLADYDGTFAEFVPDPTKAFPDRKAKEALLRIKQKCPVLFITGRPIWVLNCLINDRTPPSKEPEKIKYEGWDIYGQYGIGRLVNGETSAFPLSEQEEKFLSDVKKAALEMVDSIIKKHDLAAKGITREVLIETNKSFARTFHWRRLKEEFKIETATIEKIKDEFESFCIKWQRSVNNTTPPGTTAHQLKLSAFDYWSGEMNYEFGVHRERINKGIVMKEVLGVGGPYKDKTTVLWLCDELCKIDKHTGDTVLGSDGFAARAIKELTNAGKIDGYILRVISSPNAPEPTDDVKPDFTFNNPAELGAFLNKVYNKVLNLQSEKQTSSAASALINRKKPTTVCPDPSNNVKHGTALGLNL